MNTKVPLLVLVHTAHALLNVLPPSPLITSFGTTVLLNGVSSFVLGASAFAIGKSSTGLTVI